MVRACSIGPPAAAKPGKRLTGRPPRVSVLQASAAASAHTRRERCQGYLEWRLRPEGSA
jgi:hypothetical protein